jgi:hypothetical protein
MLFARNKHLNPLQRRSGVLFGVLLILTMIAFAAAHLAAEHAPLSKAMLRLIELLPAVPVAAMVVVTGRYLARESDEFIRMVVTQALLWGFGVAMIGDIVFGVVFAGFSAVGITQIYNIDVFVITAIAALAVQLRSAQ